MWRVQGCTGSAGALHARELPTELERTVWVLDVDRPALVLGSTQRIELVDVDACARAGVELVRRRSGGGAVLLQPGDLWVDLLLPRRDPLWIDDVGTATHWVGDMFAAALGHPATVHRGALLRRRWSAEVCFAGVGPGEVTAGPGGPKMVGISQRRTRNGARFQCAALRRWDAVETTRLLHLEESAARDLAAVALGVRLSADDVLSHLP